LASPVQHDPLDVQYDPADTWLVRVNETFRFDPIGSGDDNPNIGSDTVRVRGQDVLELDPPSDTDTKVPDSFLITVVAGEGRTSAKPVSPARGAPVVEVRIPG
jgi:hypothetical protein